MFRLTASPIEQESLLESLKNDKTGALVVFEGWVRNHNEEKEVSSLEYQVYEALAQKEGEKILQEALHRFNLHQILCTHRFGHLKLGETAVWIGATASHRDDAYQASRYVIDQIKIRLPIWKKEHYRNEEANWVFCKDHPTHVHFHEADYYRKQAKLIEQERLKNAQVLVIGVGGLGCPVLLALAAAGVGKIDIVDFDQVTISNIHRQPLYSPGVVGEKKARIAEKKLTELNPFIQVRGHVSRVVLENVESFVTGRQLVLDCTDNLETRFLLHDACFRQRVPLVSASIFQFEGQIRTFVPGMSGCLRCTYETTPDDSHLGNCNDYGVLGAAVGAVGSIQANEALLFLSEGKNNTMATTYFLNLKTLEQMKLKNRKKENCSCCDGKMELNPVGYKTEVAEVVDPDEVIEKEALRKLIHSYPDAQIVDVRDQEDSVLDQYIGLQKPIVVYCHRGVRSQRLVRELRSRGHLNFYSLKGGACSL